MKRVFTYLIVTTIWLNAQSQILQWNKIVSAENEILRCDVLFDYSSDQILPDSEPILDSIYDFIKRNNDWVFEIGVHCDTRGKDQNSLELTKARAKAILSKLTSKSISANRLIAKGYEGSQPLIKGEQLLKLTAAEQEEAHATNRRVELKVLYRYNPNYWGEFPIPAWLSSAINSLKPDSTAMVDLRFGLDDTPQSEVFVSVMDSLIRWLNENPDCGMLFRFHTYSRGHEGMNLDLNTSQAKYTLGYLTYHGIDPKRIKTESLGEKEPLIPDAAILAAREEYARELAHFFNQRTEIIILKM